MKHKRHYSQVTEWGHRPKLFRRSVWREIGRTALTIAALIAGFAVWVLLICCMALAE